MNNYFDISAFFSTFAVKFNKILNSMIVNDLFNISVNFNDMMHVSFVSKSIEGIRGNFFKENNFAKSDEDCAYITLFPKEKRILLRIGVVTYVFQVQYGDTSFFFGHYSVTFCGHEGDVIIYRYRDDNKDVDLEDEKKFAKDIKKNEGV